MNDKFASQKETLLSIKHEISLLYQQINYLLRIEKPLELLDLDVLMNRTHTLYDQLCSINVGDESLDEELPFDAEALSSLFGGVMQDEPESAEEEPAAIEEEPVFEEPQPEPQPEPETVVENPIIETVEPVTEKVEEIEPMPEPVVVEETNVEPQPEPEPESEPEPELELEPEDKPMGDEFGFFFRFEDIPEKKEPETVSDAEGRVVHVMEAVPEEEIPERDRVHGDDLVKDNPLVMPRLDEERKAEKEEIERESEVISGFFGKDDTEFELSTCETLGEKMMAEDHSLAAKLQQNPVPDLKSVIGINDKFLFVNELFGGSMEKYNKSIENLNDLKTLNGAMIYLNELKIELQWNSSNEAYLKLKDLVSRKFE